MRDTSTDDGGYCATTSLMASSSATLHRAPERRRARKQKLVKRQKRAVFLAAGGIALALAALVALRLITSTPTAASDSPVSEQTLAAVSNVPAATFQQVGAGSAQKLPTSIQAQVRRGPSGLPLVTYVGAEYCPFCAAERWALVVALSRFGHFSGLQMSHSASDDVYPNTATFSFVGATYLSQYLDFSSVELQSNQRSGGSYAPLQAPTTQQQQLLRMFDVPPYVPANSAGAIPFVDLADQYMISGSSYDVGVLRGQTVEQIAASLSDPSLPTTQAIIGSANSITAALCRTTGGSPSDVCGQPSIQALQASLTAAPSPAATP
jgi:hypothetical protein